MVEAMDLRTTLIRVVLALLLTTALVACAPLIQYRTDYQPCGSTLPQRDCTLSAIEDRQGSADEATRYMLGFIEFDDQGQLFDRQQLWAVMQKVEQTAADNDFIAVVFIHGWKHNAMSGDENIDEFRRALVRLSQAEHALSQQRGLKPRSIIGIYMGWRGLSLSWPVLKELTFWDRKSTAHKVGHGGVTETLNRLDVIRQVNDLRHPDKRSRLIVVGHSFGGAVAYSAISQILESRFIATSDNGGAGAADVAGFGNLVVLVNPAFEALLYSPLHDMSSERRHYGESQLPVLAVLTSEADKATKIAFPAGRWFTTLFQKERSETNQFGGKSETISQRGADITALGHFAPYQTHTLTAAGSAREASSELASPQKRVSTIDRAAEAWEQDAPGGVIAFPGSVLARSASSPGRDPYLVIKVDKALIPNHNDIWDPRVQEFVSDIILISSLPNDIQQRKEQRARAAE